jgi:hypothetical protein
MNAITQMIMQQLGGSASQKIAQRFGISESTANTAIQMAVPLLVTALARNASQPQEAQNLHQAVATDHDGSIFDNLTAYLGNPQSANGAGILKPTARNTKQPGPGDRNGPEFCRRLARDPGAACHGFDRTGTTAKWT